MRGELGRFLEILEMTKDQVLAEYALRDEHVAMLEIMSKIPNVSSKMLRARAKISPELLETYIQDLESRELASRFTLVKKVKQWVDSIELTEKGNSVLQKYQDAVEAAPKQKPARKTKVAPDSKSFHSCLIDKPFW